jgi:ribose transport system permease protein
VTADTATVTVDVTSRGIGRRLSAVRDYGIVFAFLALFIVLSLTSNVFFTRANMLNVAFQAAPVGVAACGATLVFIGGGFDLSVGAVSAIAGVIAAKTAVPLGNAGSLVVGALSGLGFGVLNGLAVTVGRINPFIATFASSMMISGLALAISGGYLISVSSPSFATLGLGTVGTVGIPVYVWLGFALFCGFILWKTTLGEYIYAAGGNAEAARLSGVRVGVVKTSTYAISGLSGGIAGIILTSEVSAGQADANSSLTFAAIAAVVIGGTSILGGEGAIWRSVLGALLFQMIGNGFDLLNVQTVYQEIVEGAIMLSAVGLDAWVRTTRR